MYIVLYHEHIFILSFYIRSIARPAAAPATWHLRSSAIAESKGSKQMQIESHITRVDQRQCKMQRLSNAHQTSSDTQTQTHKSLNHEQLTVHTQANNSPRTIWQTHHPLKHFTTLKTS